MKLSIIVPVFNAQKHIEKNINSLINQIYKDIEIIYIDDGSSDKSGQIIQNYQLKDNRIIYKKINNHGVSFARNLGISIASGDYISFVDADDFVREDFLNILLCNLRENNADISICECILTENKNYYFSKINNNCFNEYENKYSNLLEKYNGYLCNKLYIKEIIDRYNIRLNESIHMCEDLLFNFEYFSHINKIVYTNDILYAYIMDNNSSKKINIKWFTVFDSYKEIYAKYMPLMNTKEKDILDFYFASTVFYAKIRSDIMQIKLDDILAGDILNMIKKAQGNRQKLLKSENLSYKQKIKLISYNKLYPFAKYIKKRELIDDIA